MEPFGDIFRMVVVVFKEVRILVAKLLVVLSDEEVTSKTCQCSFVAPSGTLKKMLGVDMKQTLEVEMACEAIKEIVSGEYQY